MVRGQLTESQIRDVDDRARSTKEAAEKAIRSAWTHILYPQKDEGSLDGKPFDIAQTTLLSRDRPSIAASVYEKLSSRGDSIVKDTLGPKILMAKLAPLWPPDRPHLPIAEIRKWFSAYVYLPKLRDFAVLDGAIAEGISGSDPQFGYATEFSEASGKYEELVYARLAPMAFSLEGVLVRKAVAAAQAAADSTAGKDPVPPGGPTVPPRPGEPPALPVDHMPRRFYGSVEIDADGRPIKAFETILNAVVMELQSTHGAKVKLTLEIEAEAPAGFSVSEVSVVRDNARQLKFRGESTGFGD